MEQARRDKRVCVEGVSSQASDEIQTSETIQSKENGGHAHDSITSILLNHDEHLSELLKSALHSGKDVRQLEDTVLKLRDADLQSTKYVLQLLNSVLRLQDSNLQLWKDVSQLQKSVSQLQDSVSQLQERASKMTTGEQVSPMSSRPAVCLDRHSHHTCSHRHRMQ
jgi:X-X-X-Leu-X-X-Gly heptad repeat protein